MSRFFNWENPAWQFLGKLVDVFVVHLLWAVISCGIVTFGPATTALYYALMKDVADENPHYVRMFFKSFKENFRQGAIMGLIFLATGGVLAFSIYYYANNASESRIMQIGLIAAIAISIIWVFTFQYAFPLLARFANTIPGILRNAIVMPARHIGWTLLMTLLLGVIYFIVFFFNFYPLLLFGFGLAAYVDCYILNHIFEPYIQAAGGRPGEKGDPDAWTVEEIPEEEVKNAESGVWPPVSADITKEKEDKKND